MIKCINCGEPILESATRCKHCYAKQIGGIEKNTMLVTSTNSIDGYEAIEYYGFIFGETVCPNGVFGAITNGTFFTISALTDARSKAIDDLKNKARNFGANAILGLDIDISDLDGRGVLVSANGTAAYLIPSDAEGRADAVKHEQEQREKKSRDEQAQKEQADNQRRIELQEKMKSSNNAGLLDNFFSEACKCTKYRDIDQVWKRMELNLHEEYEEITNKIQAAVEMERFYGSREEEILERLLVWKKTFLDEENVG